MEGNEIVQEIFKQSPAMGMLIAAIYYFKKRESQKEQDIKELNKELRELDRKNLEGLLAVVSSLEKNTDKIEELENLISNFLMNGNK